MVFSKKVHIFAEQIKDMGFHLKSYRCDKCHQVDIGGDKQSHVCPKPDESVYFNIHEIKTAAFYSKMNQKDINDLLYSLSKLFKK